MSDIFDDNPLIAFSVNTHVQVQYLLEFGNDVSELIDSSFLSEASFDATKLNKAYGGIWLWTLGTYEVIRTMTQVKDCFSETLATELVKYKRYLSKIRMPFAKQEYANNKGSHAFLELLISGFDIETRDFKFIIEGESYFFKKLLKKFRSIILSIRLEDINYSKSYCNANQSHLQNQAKAP